MGTWANITDDTNINGGGWNWQIDMRIAATGTPDDVTTLRGGIVVGKCGIIQPLKGQVMQGADSRNNFLTGGTDFTIWWEIVRVSVPTGAITVNFYYRPTSFIGQPQTNGAVLWGQVTLPATAESQRISMRPLLYTGGANPKYVIECYGATVNTIANTIVGATVTGASVPLALDGYFTVSDPDDTTAANIRCDLYRNLPLRQCVVNPRSNGRLPVKINAIHHGDGGTDMAGANQLASLPYSFGFSSIDPYQQTVDKLDGINATLSRKSTIGYALGFQTAWVQQTATLMIGTGVVAEIPITESIPLNTSLVVTLPDLPISGFYGNSAGSASAGTLNLNAGGQAGCILAVIPFTQAPIRATALGEGQRGVFYASPMENWIKLKNPTSFNISSLRCVITDALGQKPHCLAPNTTVCIKIKAPNGGENARLQIQG